MTSNRDEKHSRSMALPPQVYQFDSGNIIFPKDGNAGGTWIALHQNGNAVIFLNGGFAKHTPQPSYRKSRGLILLDIIDSITPYNSFLVINLNNIEPFTAIIWDDEHLFECRWDGIRKHNKKIDSRMAEIWSSVTLYDDEVISKRRQWFEKWAKKNKRPSQDDIINFHQFTGDGDSHNDLMMNRKGQVYTVSVTSIAIGNQSAIIQYLDVKNNQASRLEFGFEKSMAGPK